MSSLPRLTSLAQLSPAKLATEEIEVPALGVSVLVRELTGEQIEQWKAGNLRTKGGKVIGYNLSTSAARLLALAIVDDTGNPIFNANDIASLMRTHGAGSIAKIEEAARRLSGLSQDQDEEDGEGNGSTPNELSSID